MFTRILIIILISFFFEQLNAQKDFETQEILPDYFSDSIATPGNIEEPNFLISNFKIWFSENESHLYTLDSRKIAFHDDVLYFRIPYFEVRAAFIDNDDGIDMIYSGQRLTNYIFKHKDTNRFIHHTRYGKKDKTSRNLKVIDVDGDTDIDIVRLLDKSKNELCINNGEGLFEKTIFFGKGRNIATDIEIVDVNNDGQLDIALSIQNGSNVIYLNDKMRFKKRIYFGDKANKSSCISSSDINNDGYIDLIIGNKNDLNYIYYGSPEFTYETKESLSSDNSLTTAIDIADFNKDGKDDILIGNELGKNKVLIQNDEIQFDTYTLNKEDLKITDVKFEDLNNDGYLDIILVDYDYKVFYYTNELYKNLYRNF